MEEPKKFDMKVLAASAVVFLILGIGIGGRFSFAPDASVSASSDAAHSIRNIDLEPLFKAADLLDENFAPATTTDPLTDADKLWGAIQGLTNAYGDDYTVFLPPVEKEIFESDVSGNFEGVGMEIDVRDGVLTVVAPLKGTPAYLAGIESGDLILKIDDEDTRGITVGAAVQKIRGPKGSTVVFNISRAGAAPFDISVVRGTIDLPTVDTTLRDDGVFVLQLFTFNALAPQKIQEAIREFADSGSDKLIIDLRGNPGGFLEVAVDFVSWFLPVGKPVVIEDYGDKQPEVIHRSRGYNVFTDRLKLAILIDGGSASASEIFAGALHAYGKGTLVGTKSFGKGSVQQTFPITDDTLLKVTVARWLTPDRISISRNGIEPDIDVEITDEDRKEGRDPQLERAAEFLKTGE